MKTINIQSMGQIEAKPAQDFKIGERMMWNFGGTTEVLAVVKETPKMITYLLGGTADYPVKHERKFKKTRLVAIG